tara:strand:- start:60797 stop:62245 length:1449 start_codon:yes stop_codon:yes gene_type:complete
MYENALQRGEKGHLLQNSSEIWDLVDAKARQSIALSDNVWDVPELLYEEHESARLHTEMLEAEGFTVTRNLGGIATAVMGEAGEGGPVIAILGEYDALPGLSQEAGADAPAPLVAGGNGHGCGHNLLGAGALAAATAVKDYLALHGLPGRVRYYGCPAEEGGAAKTFLVRDGHFDDVDAALSWHPMSFNGVIPALTLAVSMVDFHFSGRTAHAAVAPHLGRSALDAVELMSVGVNYLREHVPQDCRIHYAYLDAGGRAPNVVQSQATVRYSVRALRAADMRDLVARVRRVADGAAMMTDTKVNSTVITAMSEMLENTPLNRLLHDNLARVGPPQFDAEDRDYASRIQATLVPEAISAAFEGAGIAPVQTPLHEAIVPLEASGVPMLGSTDLGDVSWVVPFAQAQQATHAIGTPGHTWQITAQGKSPAAHKAMINVAKALASTALDLMTDPKHLAAAKADHARRVADNPYVPPLAPDAQPRVP